MQLSRNHTMPAKQPSTPLNPRTTSYEFLGPPGAAFVSTIVPILSYALFYGCSERAGGCPRSYYELPEQFYLAVKDVNWWKSQWDPQGVLIYFAWYAYVVLAWFIVPGDWVEGLATRTGQKVKYKINGEFLSLHALSSRVDRRV